jgi:two-component system, NtrC family, sensor kinase
VVTALPRRKQSEMRRAALLAVTNILAEADSLEATIDKTLKTLGESLGWDVGAFWLVDAQRNLLCCQAVWHRPTLQAPKFLEMTRSTKFAPGMGLPGRVLETGLPAWVADVVGDASFPRAKVAASEGLHGAFGFPILASGETIGVIEFFLHTLNKPDEDMLSMLVALGSQVGQFLERKQIEDALRESEAFYHSLVESLPQNIIRKDREGRFTFANQRCCTSMGKPLEQVVGKTDYDLFPPELAEKYRQDDLNVLATGNNLEAIEEHLTPAGDKLYVQIVKSPIYDSQGEMIGTQVLYWDVTENNRMRTALIQSEKLASIGLLSAGVAHEINNPLAYVANNLVVLERDVKGMMGLLDIYEASRDQLAKVDAVSAAQALALAEELDLAYVRSNFNRVLGRTKEGVQRVARIVHSLRGLARTDRPQMEEAHLPDLVDMSLEMIRGRLQRQGIQLVTDYRVTKVRCVAAQISQVLLNLIVNALQSIETKDNAEGASIRINTDAQDSEVFIEVADTGCGIDPDHMARLFDPFFTTKPVGEGTGLGLSITHGIVTGHGGRIEVDSKPGQGSRFRIFLPQ